MFLDPLVAARFRANKKIIVAPRDAKDRLKCFLAKSPRYCRFARRDPIFLPQIVVYESPSDTNELHNLIKTITGNDVLCCDDFQQRIARAVVVLLVDDTQIRHLSLALQNRTRFDWDIVFDPLLRIGPSVATALLRTFPVSLVKRISSFLFSRFESPAPCLQ
jgi:hypothetical protein